jgi:glyoxylase-like metal-dependent hydrolase (beta-lactamase superfamily II)
MKKIMLSIMFICGVQVGVSASVQASSKTDAETIPKDPYLSGFTAYAAEINKMGGQSGSSFSDYVQEVQKTEKSVGFIGQALNLPQPVKVAEGVYTVVGSLIWHNPSNYGLNNNLTFIEFDEGVFVFNAGPNPAVAYSLHQMIKRVTNKPVKWVAVENSQGHAYLGASYWTDIGVKNLYSHKVANQTFHKYFKEIKNSWSERVGKRITLPAKDVTHLFTEFENKLVVPVGGGETLEILNFGPGHTPGSTLVYVPSRNILLTGDVAYNHRSLALFAYTDTEQWIKTFDKMTAYVPQNVTVIPGHGAPTTLAKIKEDTKGYLAFLRAEVKKVIDAGGTEMDVVEIDQSHYKNRPVFEQTHQNNAVHIYKEMTQQDLGQSFE